MKFDVAFEDSILAECLNNVDYLKKACRLIAQHHFSGKERSWIWKVIEDQWTKHRERATVKLMKARLVREFSEEEQREPYLLLIGKLRKLPPGAPKAALDELEKFSRTVDAQIAIEQAAESLGKGDVEAAEGHLAKANRNRRTQRRYTHIRWLDELEDRQAKRKYDAEHPEEHIVIPTGFPSIDRIMSGGGRKGEVGLIVGTTGRGKSITLNNLGHAGVLRGFKVAHFVLEMPAHQAATRQDSLWSGIDYSKFKDFAKMDPSELRKIERRWKRDMARFKNHYHILSFPVRSASIHDIRGALDDLHDEFEGFRPDLVLMDSGDHLLSPEFSKETLRVQQADVYWRMKEMAEEDGYVLWSSTHAGREWAKTTATAESTSEAYDKARIADTVITVNQPMARKSRPEFSDEDDDAEDDEERTSFKGGSAPSDDGVRRLELFLAKYRDGESAVKIPVEAEFKKMKIREVEVTT